jgi:dienelactone hydrolase
MSTPIDPISLSIPLNEHAMHGDLAMPHDTKGVVIFAHGSGSSRHSPRNRYVASVLQFTGLATLLIDLLTTEEDRIDQRTLQYRFDIALLADRLVKVTDWVHQHHSFAHLKLGYFGASTGAAAALIAAAERPQIVEAVVSRGGRPDLAGRALSRVLAPTLLIVGERDNEVALLNQQAAARISAPTRIEIVPGATHLFEETGTLEQVALLAREWFMRNLTRSNAA